MRDLQRHPIDETFSRGLKDAKVPAPDRVWEGVSSQMENQRLRRKVFYAQWTAVAAVALLLGFGGWYAIWGSKAVTGNPQSVLVAGQNSPVRKLAALPFPAFPVKSVKDAPSNPLLREGTQVGEAKILKNLTGKPNLVSPKKVSLLTSPGFRLEEYPFILPEVSPAPSMVLMEKPSTDLTVNKDFIAAFETDAPSERKEKLSRFQLGAGAGPDFAFQSQTPVAVGRVGFSPKTVLPKNAENAERASTPAMAVSAGMNLSYSISERVSVQSGALYTNRKSDTGHGIMENGKAESAATHFDVSYLEVPAMMRYDFMKGKKIDTYVSGGASATMFLSYNSYFQVDDQIAARTVSNPDDAMSLAQANALLAAGMDIRLTDHLKLNIEPRLRYGVITNDRSFSQDNPLSLAGFSGIRYQF